ncbi:SusE domain-containing protein [Winogradskyella sp. SM1960]|uniref:SusE domain-containing protein n=1 Tax=Winogradskyella sp. SM1960 TaxID=2865955 RepID=UPI001CD3DC8B|nr:SusE domain-containing protein [Winogradskyella sp. SM1960]
MKNILKFKVVLLTVFTLGFLVNSCEDDTSVFTATETEAITLAELPITVIELDDTNPGNPAITFNWNEADYGQQASENYAVIFATDDAFTNPVVATTITGSTSATLSVNELNSSASAAGLPPFMFNTLYAKVESSIGTQNGLPVSSNIISFQIQPFYNYTLKDFYIVGNALDIDGNGVWEDPDWNNNSNNPPLFRNAINTNLYTYTGYFGTGSGGFDQGRFKILGERGQWQPQWGVTDNEGSDTKQESGNIAGNPTTQDGDPGRFGVETDGYYTFTINFSRPTDAPHYTFSSFDVSGATDYTSIAIEGDALSGENVEMTQSNADPHIWNITNVNLQTGDLQFVTNTGSTWGGDTSFSGVATDGGGSIPVIVQDDYEVWFNDLTGDYILIPLNL